MLSFLLSAFGCCGVDGFQKLYFERMEKLHNWVRADVEALKYKDKEPEARLYLQELRTLGPHDVSNKLKRDGFHWRSEIGDFTNYPWVTIAGRRGDCDDFMVLWESILKDRGKTERVFVAGPASAHAMLLFTKDGMVLLLSNMDVFATGKPGEEDKMIRMFYGAGTVNFIRYQPE